MKQRYLLGVQRLTVHASAIDYNRLFNGLSERKYNHQITRCYARLYALIDLYNMLP